MNEIIGDLAVATVKGAVSSIPFIGGLLAEYIGLAQEKITDKRIKEWIESIENRLEKLNCDMKSLSENELFFTSLHIATGKILKELQREKREYFANAVFNTIHITDISEDKKMVFFFLLEKYTLSSIKLLKLYSENNYRDSDYVKRSGSTITTIHPGQEKAFAYIQEKINEFKNEAELVKNLTTQLFYDGLIEEIDFSMPEYPDQSRRKRTTELGDEFLKFIKEQE